MKILGLDPGTATTGFAIIEKVGSRFTALDFGVITTPAGLPLPARLAILATDLEALLAQHCPAKVGVEGLFFCKNITTGIAVAHARGVLLLTLARHGLTPAEPTPLQVKQAVTGYGQAKKPQVQAMVCRIFNLQKVPRPDDAADALAVAYAVA